MTAPAAFRRFQAPSSEAIGVVLEAIGAEDYGERSMKLATILPLLVVEAGKLGELVEYDAIAGGPLRDEAGAVTGRWAEPVVGRGMRAEWFERLASAIATGAIDKVTPKQAVEILLRPRG